MPRMSNSESKRKPAGDRSHREHLIELLSFDEKFAAGGDGKPRLKTLIGIDEVGRGCLAGPVVAAAVILPTLPPEGELLLKLARLDDSKRLSPSVRAELATILLSVCRFGIGEATVEEIDRVNILQATFLAMRRAFEKLKITLPCLILVDGNKAIPSLKLPQQPIPQGDGRSASIAAASVLAKVHRDELMCRLSKLHPQYMWHSNKGYGSPDHMAALERSGLSPFHRLTFTGKSGKSAGGSGPSTGRNDNQS